MMPIPQIKRGSQRYWRCQSEQAVEYDSLVMLLVTATCENCLANQLCHCGECYQELWMRKESGIVVRAVKHVWWQCLAMGKQLAPQDQQQLSFGFVMEIDVPFPDSE